MLLQSAEVDWCASVYLCFVRELLQRTEPCSKHLIYVPASMATALPIQMLNSHLNALLQRVTGHCCVKQNQRVLSASLCAENTVL